jgi:hypothetical protein
MPLFDAVSGALSSLVQGAHQDCVPALQTIQDPILC